MKKNAVFVLITVAILLCCLFGCHNNEPTEYGGENADLYTEAIHSILGADGIEVTINWHKIHILLEVLEEDAFGRKLFVYNEFHGPFGTYGPCTTIRTIIS